MGFILMAFVYSKVSFLFFNDAIKVAYGQNCINSVLKNYIKDIQIKIKIFYNPVIC